MHRDYIPTRDTELLQWSQNFLQVGSAAPADFGWTPAQMTAYGDLHDAFVVAMGLVGAPETRSRVTIAQKNAARKALIAEARKLARIAQAFPQMDNQRRAQLGITQRKDEPTPHGPPQEKAVVEVRQRDGNDVTVRVHDGSGGLHRGKPEGVAGIMVYTHVGPTPPATAAAWTFAGNHSRTLIRLSFDPTLPPGTTVWISAYYYNAKGQTGPGSTPVSTFLAGGALPQAA